MPIDDFNLTGKVAVVTGGTRGIGLAIAQDLKDCGCEVIATGTADVDLSDDRSVKNFCATIANLPRLDILINNAGINKVDLIQDVADEDWDKIIKVNLTSCQRLMKPAASVMINKKIKGKILNVSSIFGIVSRPKRNAYSASKNGLIGLTHASSLDLAPHGILVNAICPGFIATEMTASILSETERQALSAQVPLGRFGNTEEIAHAAVFLCSDMNTYMTGQTLVVDGGFTIR